MAVCPLAICASGSSDPILMFQLVLRRRRDASMTIHHEVERPQKGPGREETEGEHGVDRVPQSSR